MGVYDVNNEDFDEKKFKPSSTEPVVRIQGMKEEDMDSSSSDGDGSDDSALYYEFDSDAEVASHTTKSTSTMKTQGPPARKPPMIIDITPPNVAMKEVDEDDS